MTGKPNSVCRKKTDDGGRRNVTGDTYGRQCEGKRRKAKPKEHSDGKDRYDDDEK